MLPRKILKMEPLRLTNISVSSKSDHPPGRPPGNIFERVNSPLPGHKESAKARPMGQKNRATAPPPGQLFSKMHQKTKHGTETMKNSTEMLICLEILKTVKHIKA